MKDYLQKKIYEISGWIEVCISVLIIIALIIFSGMIVWEMIDAPGYFAKNDAITIFLEEALGIVVGIEFVKMLVRHTPGNVIEVLLFATSRQIIIDHSSITYNLIGVICIAILFATRKYLFVSFDESETMVYRGSQKVKFINHIAKVNIPLDEGETLREVVANELKKQDGYVGIGACVYFDGVALRIDHMVDHKITKVEVIKELH